MDEARKGIRSGTDAVRPVPERAGTGRTPPERLLPRILWSLVEGQTAGQFLLEDRFHS